jgi:hypothetical protein
MRLRSMSAPLVLTLLATNLTLGCGEADKADDGGADGAGDGGSAAGGAADGAADASADGASDGAADGSADGSSDGSADGGDGAADGSADSGDGGGSADEVVFSDGFEDVRVEDGAWVTDDGIGVNSWLLTPFHYSGYDATIGEFLFTVNGGLFTDDYRELTSADPLPAPAGGQQCMYLSGYASRDDGSIGGYFDLHPEAVTIEAERRYVLDLALGQRAGLSGGVAQVFFYADGGGPDQVLDQADVQIDDLPVGGFANYRLEIDPTDSLAGTPLNVRVQLYQAYIGGYTSFLVDNVTITAVPAAAN